MLAAIVSWGMRLNSWLMTLMPARCDCIGSANWTSRPSTKSEPDVGWMLATEHLDERGLAGAVLAHERMDLARQELEVDLAEGQDAGELLGDLPRFEDGLAQGSVRSDGCRGWPGPASSDGAGPPSGAASPKRDPAAYAAGAMNVSTFSAVTTSTGK